MVPEDGYARAQLESVYEHCLSRNRALAVPAPSNCELLLAPVKTDASACTRVGGPQTGEGTAHPSPKPVLAKRIRPRSGGRGQGGFTAVPLFDWDVDMSWDARTSARLVVPAALPSVLPNGP